LHLPGSLQKGLLRDPLPLGPGPPGLLGAKSPRPATAQWKPSRAPLPGRSEPTPLSRHYLHRTDGTLTIWFHRSTTPVDVRRWTHIYRSRLPALVLRRPPPPCNVHLSRLSLVRTAVPSLGGSKTDHLISEPLPVEPVSDLTPASFPAPALGVRPPPQTSVHRPSQSASHVDGRRRPQKSLSSVTVTQPPNLPPTPQQSSPPYQLGT